MKPTKRAQAASQQAQANASGRRNEGGNSSQVTDKQLPQGSKPSGRQKKISAQPSSQRCTDVTSQAELHGAAPAQSQAISEHIKHRPVQPSNLGLPPILPSSLSTAGTTSSQLDDNSKSKLGASPSVDSPKASASSGLNPTVEKPPPRLRIILRPPSFPASAVPTTSRSESTSSNANSLMSSINPPVNAPETANRGRRVSRSGSARPRGPRNGRGRGRRRERESTFLAPSAETLEAVPDSTKALPTADPTGNAEASTAVKPPVVPPTLVDALRSAVDTTSRAQSHGADSSIGARDDDLSMTRSKRTSQLLLRSTDPGNPQGKKRKLGDCED